MPVAAICNPTEYITNQKKLSACIALWRLYFIVLSNIIVGVNQSEVGKRPKFLRPDLTLWEEDCSAHKCHRDVMAPSVLEVKGHPHNASDLAAFAYLLAFCSTTGERCSPKSRCFGQQFLAFFSFVLLFCNDFCRIPRFIKRIFLYSLLYSLKMA